MSTRDEWDVMLNRRLARKPGETPQQHAVRTYRARYPFPVMYMATAFYGGIIVLGLALLAGALVPDLAVVWLIVALPVSVWVRAAAISACRKNDSHIWR